MTASWPTDQGEIHGLPIVEEAHGNISGLSRSMVLHNKPSGGIGAIPLDPAVLLAAYLKVGLPPAPPWT